ncbi:cation-translocating P-type ATPase, partial [Candidatus Woesearchaeota archaeon]|nr:cation-translocating P-type ATPase [Candidatus Woesearchaeota archaeon]
FIIFILFAAAAISAAMGDWVEVVAILVVLLINAVMGFVQEFKAEKSIEALQKLASLQAVVLRDGKQVRVDAKELVPGDVIILETGEKLPADARIIASVNLKTQEGALTGESMPVEKTEKRLSSKLPLGDQANMVFSGTIITNGRGKAVVTATGMQTQIGRIAGMIEGAPTEQTPLQRKLGMLGRMLGLIVIAVSVVVFLTGWLRGGDLKEMFGTAVALAVAAIPEGLPVVITIALGFGVRKMVRKNALIRKLPSVETLGAVTVICSDKTGTLTHNQMTVTHVYADGKVVDVTGSGYEPEGEVKGKVDPLLFRIGALCNDARLTEGRKEWGVIGDPTEGCLITAARKAGLREEDLRSRFPRVDEIGFDSSRKMMTTFHRVKGDVISYTKGAPDNILKRCDRILVNGRVRALTKNDLKVVDGQIRSFSEQALRVLGFAYNQGRKKGDAEKRMVFVGLQAMIDPPREEVKTAIAKCRSAGIKVIMVTGDHLVTAQAIAKQLGIEGEAMEGKDIVGMDLRKEVKRIGVFARVNPEHKLRIVDALKHNGHVVAMTGDGVNDAPALKKADIGVSMGVTGTDVAKEASSMILTDDNFASIVSAVEEGRNIYDNIKKFVNYLLSSNIGEVLVMFVAILIGFTAMVDGEMSVVVPLGMFQILWINLITDSLPALALGVDPADPNIMGRKPRDAKEHIIGRNMMWNIAVIGVLMTVSVLFVFGRNLGAGVEKAQTMALTMLVILEIVRLEMIRSQYHAGFFSNKWLTMAIVLVLGLQLLVMYTPLGQNELLGLTALSLVDWAWILGVAAVMFVFGKLAAMLIKHYTHQVD